MQNSAGAELGDSCQLNEPDREIKDEENPDAKAADEFHHADKQWEKIRMLMKSSRSLQLLSNASNADATDDEVQ